MKVNVLDEKRNQFFRRKEITADIDHASEPSPSKEALRHYLAKELGTEAEKIEVKSILTGSGLPKSRARVFAWDEPRKKKEEKKENVAQKEEGKKETKQVEQ